MRWIAPLLGLLLLGFGLRVMRLEVQSIWVDEGFSVDFATLTAGEMTAMWKARGGASAVTDPEAARVANDPLAIAVDIHPPLYYLLLHEWMPLAGRGEYAVRFPSVAVGLLLVAALYRLGTALAGRGVGLAAAGVGAVAPFYVAYSQEARMYAPVALFGGLSLYFACQALRSGSRVGRARRPARGLLAWLGLVVSTTLALYTHYSAVLVVGAENVLAAVIILREIKSNRRLGAPLLAGWTAAQGIELALFFPWLRTTIGQVASYNQNLWVPNWRHEVVETFRAFDAGLWLPPEQSLRLAAAISLIVLAGMAAAAAARRGGRPGLTPPLMAGGSAAGRSMTGGSVAGGSMGGGSMGGGSVAGEGRPGAAWKRVSLLPAKPSRLPRGPRTALLFGGGILLAELLLALAAFQVRPEFHPRYLMVLATPYYLLAGLALTALWRKWRPLGAAVGLALAAMFAAGLWGYQFDPNFAKDDTRALAQYLTAHTTPEDVIFLDAPEPLRYYYHGPAQLFYIAGDESTAAGQMTRLAQGKKRAVYVQWVLSTSDPEQLLPFLLQKYGRLVDNHTFRGYFERTYALPPNVRFELSPTDRPEGVTFDHVLRLEAAGYGPAAAGDATLMSRLQEPAAISGAPLMVALRWQLLQPVAKDYKVTAYLTDRHGHLGGQADLLLRHDQATTSRWSAGEEATNYYVLPTLSGLMPGEYTLNVAVYAEGQTERLSVLDAAGAPAGGSAALGSVDVLPPIEPVDVAGLRPAAGAGAVLAPGVRLAGYELPRSPVAQGQPLHVTLFWQVTGQPPPGLQTVLALQSPGQPQPAWLWSAPPSYPTGRWRAGDAFRDWYDPVLPQRLPPGSYQLSAGLGGALTPLGSVQVEAVERSFEAPTPQHPLHATLGGSIEFLGYDQDQSAYRPGTAPRLTLYWRDTASMADSYTAFVHVLDAGRHVVAQVDSIPDGGRMPTTGWLPGQVITDVYQLPLTSSLPAGSYQIEVGFYRGDTGRRLKVESSDAPAIDDGLLIGRLEITKQAPAG